MYYIVLIQLNLMIRGTKYGARLMYNNSISRRKGFLYRVFLEE
jgi:hypothetical protein